MGKRLKKASRKNHIALAIVLVVYAVFFITRMTGTASNQFSNMMIPMSYYILLAVSLNLMVGFMGDLSLGHAGFMSVGAYAGCLFAIKLVELFPAMPIWIYFPLAMIFGGLIAALFGVLIGIPALRLSGDYLAIITLAFGEIIKNVIINLPFLGGALGLDTQSIRPKTNRVDTLLPIVAVTVFICILLIINFVKSKHGRAITAIRDNKIAAEASGINVKSYRLAVFAISAFFAGVAGVIYGHNMSLLKSDIFNLDMSIEILVVVVLGGMGNISGSIISAIVMYSLPELLRGFADLRMLVYSVVLIAMMIFTSAPSLKGFRENLRQSVDSTVDKLKKTVKGLFTKRKGGLGK